jgi:hypothetical protein
VNHSTIHRVHLPVLLLGALLVLPPTACGQQLAKSSASRQRDEVREYFEAKDRFNREAKAAAPSQAQAALVASALKDLEARARRIIGPVSLGGKAGAYNLGWLPYGDPSGQLLDGLAFSDTSTHTDIIVSTPELIAGWLHQFGDTSSDPLARLARDDVLTWVFWKEAHVYPYVDILKSVTLPKEIVLAQLVARGNDVVRGAPDELIVGIRRGSRIYLVNTRASKSAVPSECDKTLDAAIKKSGRYFDEEEAVFLSCYARLGPGLPEFKRIVAQVRELANRFR